MPALILSIIAGMVKAIPGLVALLERIAAAARAKQATERLQEKNVAVDAAVLAAQQDTTVDVASVRVQCSKPVAKSQRKPKANEKE